MRQFGPVWRLLVLLVGLALLALPAGLKRGIFRVAAAAAPRITSVPSEPAADALLRQLAASEEANRALSDALRMFKEFGGLLPHISQPGVAWRPAVISAARFGPGGDLYLVRLADAGGVRKGSGVVRGYAAFGVISELSGAAGWVLPLDVPPARVPIIVSRSRAEGLAEATPEGVFVRYVRAASGVSAMEEGDVVVTSGRAGMFPRGVFVGRLKGAGGVSEDGLHLEAEMDAEFRYLAGDVVMVPVMEGSRE